MAQQSSGANRYPTAPCRHYRRRCSTVAPCCNRIFCCTRGHDESRSCQVRLDAARHLVNSIVCNSCKRLQPVSRMCRYSDCKTVFGSHYCAICLIWLDGHAFHCSKCNKCYSGRREEAEHCNVCNKCYPLSSRDHKCTKFVRCTMCGENLSNSRDRLYAARCGHTFHESCFKRRIATNFSCPRSDCKRPMTDINTLQRMTNVQGVVTIQCNRCQTRTQCRLGSRSVHCQNCRSSNVRIVSQGTNGAGSSSAHAQRRRS